MGKISEELLLALAVKNSGGGGGGTTNYNQLENKPQIGGVTLQGNKSLADLGIASATDLANKVDKVNGKGLSANDYTDADKSIVDGVTATLATKVDKVSGKGLSTNDYTNVDKAIVDGVTTALAGKVDTSSVGSAGGVAELDTNGKVPSSQLPSYVDDVLEYASQSAFPAEGETGKIYIAKDTNKTYRWSGTAYVEISESLALGETSSTAYAGNKGKANADAISAIKDGQTIDSFADVETALAKKVNVFTGTQEEWEALSAAEKKSYQRADFTDDYDPTAIGDLTALHTSAKSSIVNAINEVKDGLTNLEPQVVTGYTAGGYCNNIGASTTVIRMGKLIVANINLEMVSGAVPSGGTLIDGLPIPKNRAYASAVSGNNMARVMCFNGTLTVDGGTTGGGWWNILLVYVVN